MEKYYRMVIDLYKEVLLINRVNPDRVLDAQREISNAITTAIITNEPTGELELLKSDTIRLVKAMMAKVPVPGPTMPSYRPMPKPKKIFLVS